MAKGDAGFPVHSLRISRQREQSVTPSWRCFQAAQVFNRGPQLREAAVSTQNTQLVCVSRFKPTALHETSVTDSPSSAHGGDCSGPPRETDAASQPPGAAGAHITLQLSCLSPSLGCSQTKHPPPPLPDWFIPEGMWATSRLSLGVFV